jgi:hypothetical protein
LVPNVTPCGHDAKRLECLEGLRIFRSQRPVRHPLALTRRRLTDQVRDSWRSEGHRPFAPQQFFSVPFNSECNCSQSRSDHLSRAFSHSLAPPRGKIPRRPLHRTFQSSPSPTGSSNKIPPNPPSGSSSSSPSSLVFLGP